MDHAALVRKLYGAADACEELQPVARAQAHFVAIVVDRLTPNKLHHEVRKPLEGRAAIDQVGDMGMFQAGGNLPLAAELAHYAIQIEAAPDHFDSDLLLESLIDPERAVDRTHAAAADPLHDFVRPEADTQHGVGGFLQNGCFQKVVRGLVRLDKGFDLLAQIAVRLANARQVGFPLAGLQADCNCENFLYSLPACGMHWRVSACERL